MILGAHLIISCYGFWLPNDPRGSWSEFVRSWDLFCYGPPTKVDSTQSVAHVAHDQELRKAAKAALMYPPVIFDGLQARAVGTAFALMALKSGYKIYACSILNDHSHLVLGRHHYDFMQVMNLLKGAASTKLQTEGIHPLRAFPKPDGSLPSPWASQGWKVYIDSVKQMRAAIEYVEKNPEKEGETEAEVELRDAVCGRASGTEMRNPSECRCCGTGKLVRLSSLRDGKKNPCPSVVPRDGKTEPIPMSSLRDGEKKPIPPGWR